MGVGIDQHTQGFHEALEKGALSGNPVTGCRFVLEDGAHHPVDSSELAFRLTAIGAFREAYRGASPVILEPIMKVEVVAPVEFQSMFFFSILVSPLPVGVMLLTFFVLLAFVGAVIGSLNKRRGLIIDNEVREDEFTATAEVALNDMFGYSSALRGVTQGKGLCLH